MARSERGGALRVVLAIVAVLAVLLGVAAFIGWRVSQADKNRSHTRNVVVPGATWGLSDVHYGWRFAPSDDGKTCRATLTLTGVPAGTELENRAIPSDVTDRVPVAGQAVTIRLPESIPPSPATFVGGARETSVTTDAGGVATIDVAPPIGSFFALTATAEFRGEGGRPIPGTYTVLHTVSAR